MRHFVMEINIIVSFLYWGHYYNVYTMGLSLKSLNKVRDIT